MLTRVSNVLALIVITRSNYSFLIHLKIGDHVKENIDFNQIKILLGPKQVQNTEHLREIQWVLHTIRLLSFIYVTSVLANM